ncbi:hypothetical protein F5Y01DRAFT_145958 [Xylaria sp. FL0043]|nr:hypothetical protein F5Y01DRAFT_145958 [Xylaria sp. FL0043]
MALPCQISPSKVTAKHDAIRFRQSCDKCQDSKIRCSRDKPSCKRCAQKRLRCVYSPLRRTGRPKKAVSSEQGTRQSSTPLDVDEGEDPAEYNSSKSVTREASSLLSSTISHCEKGAATTTPYASGDDHTDSPMTCSNSGSQSTSDAEATHLPASTSILTTDNDVAVRSHVKEWMSNGHDQSCTPRVFGTQAAMHPCINDGILSYSAISFETPSTQLPDCHAAILTQTAKLEQTLTHTASPATIDVVLGAERDFNSLRYRLFSCTGHRTPLPPEDAGPQAWNAPPTAIRDCTHPCLATDRPVLLGLSLLAERVVGLLEDIFRVAAKSAQSIDQASDFVWSTLPGHSGPSARRLQRSLRNIANKPCVSPEMDSYRALRLGEFIIEGQAKSDAMKRVLKLRVKRMLNALEVLDSAKQKRQKGEWNIGGKPSGSPLDWGDSTMVLDTVTGTLLDDLMRRMESLQGAMVLL